MRSLLIARVLILAAFRRAMAFASANPVVAGAAITTAVLAFTTMSRQSASIGAALATTFERTDSAEPAAQALVVMSTLAGLIAGATLPPIRETDDQLRTGTVSPLSLTLGVTLLPLIAAATPMLALCAPVLVTVAADHSPWLAATLLATSTSAFTFGLSMSTSRVLRLRSKPDWFLSTGVALALCSFMMPGIALTGSIGLGPAPSLVTQSQLGPSSPWPTVAGILSTTGATTAWFMLLARPRPEPDNRNPGRPAIRIGRTDTTSILTANALVMCRRDDLRTNGLLVIAAAPIIVLTLSHALVGAESSTLLAVGLLCGAFGSAVFSLAGPGLRREQAWFLRPSPANKSALRLGLTLAGPTVSLAVMGTVTIGTAVAAHAISWGSLGYGAIVGTAGTAAALGAGLIVPWSQASAPQQLISYAIFSFLALGLRWAIVDVATSIDDEPAMLQAAMLASGTALVCALAATQWVVGDSL